ncbi:hypothetical protein TanjilG_12437 [Lupinus angustifolius]|uniref:Branched-chain-amino-acid aminotransferase n=1 Tax=Lupinus angustifolius TaxID=3871 RepID=A0A4P1QYB7_LUPAN|nr:hypothetical protein TanjilG_12437 [Lupinus angustifolius]
MGLLEGTKAYRKENGQIQQFRPQQNAIRMKNGAERMCMTSPSIHEFVHALKQTVLANKRWVPPPGKGSLYLRPLLLGTGPVLGLAPAIEYSFLIYASPVRNYFKEGSAPLNLCVDEDFDRAYSRGSGSVKTISNYAQDKCISTPAANGTILPGITRKSVIEMARDQGYQVEQRTIAVDELIEADEVFCTGTAVGVAPVGSVPYQDRRVEYITCPRTICEELNTTLLGFLFALGSKTIFEGGKMFFRYSLFRPHAI